MVSVLVLGPYVALRLVNPLAVDFALVAPEANAPMASASATSAPPPVPPRLDSALVHLSVDYPGAVLELRSLGNAGEWRAACPAPCDRVLVTLGKEARVTAPAMSRSNAFRIDPGPGVAHVNVSGGEESLRTFGLIGLATGIPLALAGTAMYSYGRYADEQGLAIAGGVVLGTGALAILAAIPMLVASTTNVRDAKGSLIAAGLHRGSLVF
jgi:hypothetical protein